MDTQTSPWCSYLSLACNAAGRISIKCNTSTDSVILCLSKSDAVGVEIGYTEH